MGSINNGNVYSPAQVAEYLDHIGLPPCFHPSASPVLDLSYLTALFVHQITTVPYENLLIHYSPQHAVSLDPQTLFTKIVANKRGRGGYCMENALLFKHMLHALGFTDAYTVGVRIRTRSTAGVPQGDFIGFVHLVIIVTLSDGDDKTRYALDVGFGGDGPTRALPLVEDLVHHNSVGTQEIRLTRGFLPGQRFRGPRTPRKWIYQYRNGAEQPWNSFYAFDAEFEFLEPDFQVMSHFTSTSPDSPQTYTPLAIRFLRGGVPVVAEDGTKDWAGVKVVGKVMLVEADVKQNITGRTELVKTCATEKERIEALREHFGILLTDEEAASIRGRGTELGRA